jgi:hypothetical protein
MVLGKIRKMKQNIVRKLEIIGLKKPVLEFEIPHEVVKIAYKYSNPNWEKAIQELTKTEWVREWCRARCLPKEYLKFSDEELEKLAEENKIPKELIDIYNNYRYRLAFRIVEKYGKGGGFV